MSSLRLVALAVGAILIAIPGASVVAAAATAPPRVYRERIQPHWFADNTRFWYRNDLAGGAREFIRVEATAGQRDPAFDHARVAESLSRLLGKPVDPTKLPVESIEFAPDGASILLRGADGSWRLRLETHAVVADDSGAPDEGLPAEAEPRASIRTGPETAIVFENRLKGEVELLWIDPEGRRVSYGRIPAGEVRRQHTFAGHVWAAVRNGAVAAVFEAANDPRRAVIEDRTPLQRRRRGLAGERPPSQTAVRSPDGNWEAFVRDHNLWVRRMPPGEEKALSFDGSPGASFRKDVQRARMIGLDYEEPLPPPTLPEVFWSPDSQRLVALQTRAVPERTVPLVESSPGDQLQPRPSSYPYLKAGDEIPVSSPRLFDVAPGREIAFARDRFPNLWELDRVRWAPDSSRFTFLYNERGHRVMRVLAVTPASDPAADATVSVLVDERCPTFFDYSNKTWLEFLDTTRELVWMSERDGWNHLYLIDSVSGAVKNAVTRGQWVVRGVDRLDEEKRRIWFRASGIRPGPDPYHVHLARVNLDGSGLLVLTEGDGTHDVQWSPDRRFFIDSWSRVDLPPVHELRQAEDGRLLCKLEDADAREVEQARGRFPERFVARGRDGTTDIWGIIHRPRGFDASKRYPVIENIYAGPHGQHVPKAFRGAYRHQEELADRGFVVVQVDGMGTNWRSKRFHDVAWKNLGDAGFPDRIAWIRAAAAKHPELDASRVGIYGGSAGGQSALRALLAHGDFYRAAAADCGCHDNRMDKIWWSEAWMGWPVGAHYVEQSNVTQAHRLAGQLLLTVGELDRNVDPSSTYQVANALIKAGKDFEYLVVPGAGHGAGESEYGRRRRADFFVRYLQPMAAPQP